MNIRKIQPEDNPIIAEIVRDAMTEFKADPATTILGDPTLDTMYENYRGERSVYYIVESDGQIVGGCGIKQLDGGDKDTCELQRMFLSKEARGKGIGRTLLELCLADARRFNYKQVYIETLSDMNSAIALYEKFGFQRIKSALGNTGHGGCDLKMILHLE